MAKTGQLKLEGGDAPEVDVTYPAKTIASLLMITDRRLRQLAQEGIIPKATRGRYPLSGCVQGYVTYLQQLKQADQEHGSEKKRLTKVRADTYELDLLVKHGDLYPRELVDDALFEAASDLAAILHGAAPRIARKLGGGSTLRQQLVDEFHAVRDNFARRLSEFSERLRDDRWHSRATARHRTRKVGKKKSPAKRKR